MKKFICYISFCRVVEAEDLASAEQKILDLLHDSTTEFNAVKEKMELEELDDATIPY